MPKSEPFERHADRYDDWFEANPDAYRSEVEALRRLPPSRDSASRSASVAAGSHHPSECRSVSTPASEMVAHARDRGIDVVKGVAEALRFRQTRSTPR